MTPRWSVSRRTVRPEDRLLPLLKRYPEVWGVLLRHGVGYRGGPGPSESVATFAMSRQLDPALFRDECSAIVRTRAPGRSAAEAVCRAYLIGGAALLVLSGACWASWLLSRLETGQALGADDWPVIQARVESQLSGWLALVCMGLSYAVLPRVWRGRLAVPWLSGPVLGLMLSSLSARVVGLGFASGGRDAVLENAAAWLQFVAVPVFVAQFVLTFRQSRTRAEPITGFLMVGFAWLLGSTVLSALDASLKLAVASSGMLVPLGWSSPFREPLGIMRVHGLALSVSLGLSLSLLPRYFNLPASGERRAWWSLDLITTAVLAEILLAMALVASGVGIFVVGLVVSRLMLAVGVGVLLRAWRPWRPIPGAGVCGWYVRGAFAWLVLSMVLLVLQPALDLPVWRAPGASHEASRYALTSGYLTLLLMGIATRAVASRRDRGSSRIPGLAWVFWLVIAASGFGLLSLAVGENETTSLLLLGSSTLAWVVAMGCWGLILWRLWSGTTVAAEAVLP